MTRFATLSPRTIILIAAVDLVAQIVAGMRSPGG